MACTIIYIRFDCFRANRFQNDSFMGTHNMSTPKIDRGSAEVTPYNMVNRPSSVRSRMLGNSFVVYFSHTTFLIDAFHVYSFGHSAIIGDQSLTVWRRRSRLCNALILKTIYDECLLSCTGTSRCTSLSVLFCHMSDHRTHS